ncbi:MAG TPA: hypothetical protein VGU46_04320 [Acidobacteriaceae bacterium]|nr:hypothetical protein [Acidobacteriaceae bacterium]
MTPASIEHYLAVLAGASGPAPWYLQQVASDLSTPEAKFIWKKASNDGLTELVDSNRRPYAIAPMSSYVRRISATRFVVWFKSGSQETGNLHFQLYEVSSLTPLTDEQGRMGRLTKSPFVAAAPPLGQHSIPRNQPVGSGITAFPSEFADCPELFVLVSNGNTWDSVGLNLWISDPSRQQISVTSQDWFTRGPYDFGYQWITRIARSPETGNLVGDGIRINPFVLNEDGTEFLAWLTP